jgi:hypothetical protein
MIPLSIVVATAEPWPGVRICFDSLYPQAIALGAEIILADRTGRGLPEDAESLFPGVVWLKQPGLSVYQLRTAGLARARGEVIAITEDHCRAAADWCSRILDAHRAHPEAAMIGGGVENGSPDTVVNWAAFLLGNGPSMPPVETPFQDKAALQANVSYKRRFVPHDIPPYGYMEWIVNRDLIQRGEQILADDRIRAEHVQPLRFRESCVLHYHSGRSVAAFRLRRIGVAERTVRVTACLVMPPLLVLRTLLAVVPKRRHLGWLAAALPLIFVLALCRSAGAFAGLISGPGQSPMRIP